MHIYAHADANAHTHNTHAHTRTHMLIHVHTPRLIMKFHSSPVWNFFLIKFHLLQLGFHHPITVREAEALVHAWLHQAPGKYQSMTPILLFLLPSLTAFLSSPVPFMHLCPHPWPHVISPFSQSIYSRKSFPLLFASLVHIPHPASRCHVRHTAWPSRTTTAHRKEYNIFNTLQWQNISGQQPPMGYRALF